MSRWPATVSRCQDTAGAVFASAGCLLCLRAGVTTSRKDASWPTFQSLSLPGQPGISLVGTCCRQVTWPSPREALGTSALVVQSGLQAVFLEQNGQVVAWVTTTQGQSKAVEGARVQVYASVYGKVRTGLQKILCSSLLAIVCWLLLWLLISGRDSTVVQGSGLDETAQLCKEEPVIQSYVAVCW